MRFEYHPPNCKCEDDPMFWFEDGVRGGFMVLKDLDLNNLRECGAELLMFINNYKECTHLQIKHSNLLEFFWMQNRFPNNLTVVIMNSNNITNLDNLVNCLYGTMVTHLCLNGNEIVDASQLVKLTQIRKLELDNNKIVKIDCFKRALRMLRYEYLSIRWNPLEKESLARMLMEYGYSNNTRLLLWNNTLVDEFVNKPKKRDGNKRVRARRLCLKL